MFTKILIANRGEIACRVAATARRMGVRTVAVYSDADASAKHVAACDEAVHIGGSAPKDSYLQWQRILDAAKATGAQAIHPGYGFLSENEAFANACAEAGLPCAIVSCGGTGTIKYTMHEPGVTEIQAGGPAAATPPAASRRRRPTPAMSGRGTSCRTSRREGAASARSCSSTSTPSSASLTM